MIDALIFDFDGVILDTETAWVEAWVQLHAAHDIACDRSVAEANVGHLSVAFDTWKLFPADVNRAELATEYGYRLQMIIDRLPVLPGVRDLIDEAREAGVPLAIASNSDHAHVESHLRRLKLFRYFSAIACIDDVDQPKPAPDVYALAVRRLGVDPTRSVALEDSVPGHQAAHAAGLKVVVVPNPSTKDDTFAVADWRVPSLKVVRISDLAARFGNQTIVPI